MAMQAQPTESQSTESQPTDAHEVQGRAPRITQALVWVALTALAVTLYLAVVSTGEAHVAGCGDGGGCREVLATRWSTWLGVPTSCLAAATWSVGLLASVGVVFARRTGVRRLAWSLVLLVGIMAGGAALWFISLQLWVVKAICPYCMAAHGLGLLFLLLVLVALKRTQAHLGEARAGLGAAIGAGMVIAVMLIAATGLASLIAGQVLKPDSRYVDMDMASLMAEGPAHSGDIDVSAPTSPATRHPDADHVVAPTPPGTPPGTHTEPASSPDARSANPSAGIMTDTGPGPNRTISIGSCFSFNPHDFATIGSPDAPHGILTFFCYTCPHCRDLFRNYQAIRQQYDPSRFFITVMPAPFEGRCNRHFVFQPTSKRHQGACEYARIGLAVWKAEPQKFADFQYWFFQADDPPPMAETYAHAIKLVGRPAFTAAMNDPDVAVLLSRGVDNVLTLPESKVSIPMVFMGTRTVLGGAPTRAELADRLERVFSLRKLDQPAK